MRSIFYTLLFTICTAFAAAQNYKPVDEGSKVHFSIKNFGIATGGDLSGLKGEVHFDPANLPASSFRVSVAVNTIDTDSENRDEHLRGDGYFDAAKYPEILLTSAKVDKGKEGAYNFAGTLTMHGISKDISFPFTAEARGSDYLFSGEFEINRLDFAVGEASAVLGKAVTVSLKVLCRKS